MIIARFHLLIFQLVIVLPLIHTTRSINSRIDFENRNNEGSGSSYHWSMQNLSEKCCESRTNVTAVISIPSSNDSRKNCFCLNDGNVEYLSKKVTSQYSLKRYSEYATGYPLWFSITVIVFLILLSGYCSGLNIGLLSLDETDLKIISETGSTKEEREYALGILPLRQSGNFLLVAILLGNVGVNAVLTAFLDETIGSGVVAVILSTLFIVLVGEIVPQALCMRYGLYYGYKTRYITKLIMILTGIISYPVGWFLDRTIGPPSHTMKYTRKGILQLIESATDDLTPRDIDMIGQVLKLEGKVIGDVMKSLNDVFMLPSSAILNSNAYNLIRENALIRNKIPIYNESKGRSHIVGFLHLIDLIGDSREGSKLETIMRKGTDNEVITYSKEAQLLNVWQELNTESPSRTDYIFVQSYDESMLPVIVGILTPNDLINHIINQNTKSSYFTIVEKESINESDTTPLK